MQMKKLITSLFIFSSLFCLSQKQGAIWYFGDHAGLDLSNSMATPLVNGATYNAGTNGSEGTAVLSDSAGNLLFYTNGQYAWNRNHQIMPNGDSLLGNISSTQSAIIVPKPGSSRYFYIFTIDDFNNDNLKYGFRYSVVDICLDGGFGDILASEKNIKLLDTVAEKITAVRHANGLDYWIIVHKYFSNAFYSYHLSPSGIVDTSISYIGSTHPGLMVGVGGAIGELKASPDGNKLAIVNGQSAPNIAEYFNYNRNTGIVSDCVSVQTNSNYSYYGVSFSPDNSKLYISCWLNNNGIYQFDLNAGGGNPDSVKASKTQVTNLTCYAMQLAMNGKIYISRAGNPGYVSVINYPDNPGLSCGFKDSAIYLNGKTCSLGLPNFIDSYDYSNTTYDCSNGIEELSIKQALLYPNPTSGNFSIKTLYGVAIISIYNSLSQAVYENKHPSQNQEIDLSDQNPGVYFCKIQSEAGEKVLKVIKTNP
jgi:hypothetical protein